MSDLTQEGVIPLSLEAEAALPVTCDAKFFGHTNAVSETLPVTHAILQARETTVTPGDTITFKLYPQMGVVTPRLDFDLVRKYPYVPQPLRCEETTGTLPMVSENTVFGQYYSGTSAGNGFGQVGSAYALDPHVGMGWATLFDTITYQDENGKIIDQAIQSNLLAYNTHKILTLAKTDKTDQAALWDLSQGTGLYQCAPGIQRNLQPPLNMSGTRRATSFRVENNELVATTHINMEMPMVIGGSLPLPAMGPTTIAITVNPRINEIFTEQPRFYTGMWDLIRDSGAFTNAFATRSIYAIKKYSIGPTVETTGAVEAAPGAFTENTGLIQSFLTLVVNKFVLDTCDLTHLLGDSKLVVGSPFGTYTLNGNPTPIFMYPAATIYSTGFNVQARLVSLDMPIVNVQTSDSGTAGLEPLDAPTLERMVGQRILRDVCAQVFVAPSSIKTIELANYPNFGFADGDEQQYAASAHGTDTMESNISSMGRVVITTSDIEITLPIYGADYSTITAENFGTSANPNLLRGVYTYPDNDGLPNTIWKPDMVNAKISFTLSTGTTPFSGVSLNTASEVSANVSEALGVVAANEKVNKWPYPLLIQPTDMVLENVRIMYDNPVLTAEQALDLKDAVESPEGLRITRVAFDTTVIPLRSWGQNETTYPLNDTDLYYMEWSIVKMSKEHAYGETPFLPALTFKETQLEDSKTLVINHTEKDWAVRKGGKWPYAVQAVDTSFGNRPLAQACRYFGPGGNEATFQNIAQAYGNSIGQASDIEARRFVNNALACRLRLPSCEIYGVNTLGGAARIPKGTMMKFRYTPDNTLRPALGLVCGTTVRGNAGVQALDTGGKAPTISYVISQARRRWASYGHNPDNGQFYSGECPWFREVTVRDSAQYGLRLVTAYRRQFVFHKTSNESSPNFTVTTLS